MNRRTFLKTTGLTAASLFVAPALPAMGQGGDIAENDILSAADSRIEKHRKGDLVLKLTGPDGKMVGPGTTVEIEQVRHKFLFGCNIFELARFKKPADNTAYSERFADLLNFATLPFYWWSYESQQGKPDYARTEEIIAWCKTHDVTAKGHPLAWAFVDPKWLSGAAGDPIELQLRRIDDCVRRFKGQINLWDVVNEATQFDRPDCLKNAPVLTEAIRKIGVGEYVRKCFKAARNANPDATLLINDYKTEQDYAEKVISKLVDESGKPLYDCIGIQSHQHGGALPITKIWDVCQRFAKFDKPLHFTETTLLSGKQGWELLNKEPEFKWESTPEGEKRQAADVLRFYTVLFSHPAVQAITWWDFSDQGAWQSAPAGLLRADMSPKPAYDVLKDLIKNKWWTREKCIVASDGTVRLRAFFGQYKISAHFPDRPLTGTLKFDNPAAKPVEVLLM